jgi:hypothetical protein
VNTSSVTRAYLKQWRSIAETGKHQSITELNEFIVISICLGECERHGVRKRNGHLMKKFEESIRIPQIFVSYKIDHSCCNVTVPLFNTFGKSIRFLNL